MTAPVVNTVFVPGTTITHEWLNGVNDYVNEFNPADHSAANVTYDPPFTNAVATTVENRLAQYVSVKDFGAKGDGTTNDTTAIQNAFNAAAGGCVRFPYTPNGYVVNSTITVPPNTSIEFEPGAYIDASNATAFPIFQAFGNGMSASIGGGLASAVAKGSQTITFNSAPALSAGDVIVLHNPANGSWNPVRTYYKQGEFLIVQSVSGNVVTITTSTIDSYVDTCEVYKMSSTTLQMNNIKIVGNPTLFSYAPAISIRYGYGVTVSNVELVNISDDGINIMDTLNFVCDQLRIIKTVDELPGPPATESNAIIVTGQNGVVQNCVAMTSRHSISISGGGYTVSRFIRADNCFVGSTGQWSIDLGHGHLEYCGVENSQIPNGVLVAGQNNFVKNNLISGRADGQILLQFSEMRSINHEISNNKFFIENTQIAIECAVAAYGAMTSNMQEDGTLQILDNEFIDTNNVAKTAIVIRNQGSTVQNKVEVINNNYQGPNTSVNSFLLIKTETGSRFERIAIKDNTLFNCALGVCQDWAYLNCNTNLVFVQNNTAAFEFYNGLGYCIVENNQFGGYNAASPISGTAGQPGIYVSFRNNVVRAGVLNGTDTLIGIYYASQVDSSNNKIGNMDDPNCTQPFIVSSTGAALNVTIDGDVYYGGPPTIGTNALNPSNFQFRKKIDLSTAATNFSIWTLPNNVTFMPTIAQARTDTAITATTGNYYSIGVNSNNRRIDYGVSQSAASSSQYAKNTMMQFMATPTTNSQAVTGGETLALLSVDSNSDAANIGSNMGGSGQTITVQVAGNLVGWLETLP